MVASSHRLDLVLVQEQYNSRPGILQCGINPKAGVLVLNRAIAATLLHHLSNEHCTVVHVAHGETSLHVVSAYFQYSHDIGRHIAHLESVLQRLSGKPTLVGVDSNAHSPMWHCDRRQYTGRGPDSEYRRNQMEGFILGRDLLLHNVSGQPPTFSGPNGTSNVDLTITTRGINVCDWTVHEGASLSDHQLITFRTIFGRLDSNASDSAGLLLPPFRTRGVNWANFCSTLHSRMDRIHPGLPATRYCERYSEILLRTAREILGRCGKGNDGRYEWWTPELDAFRPMINRARRKWQQSRRVGGTTEQRLHDDLRALRGRYKSAMKQAELDFFRQIAESGNDDPWGLAYREACGRLRPPPNIINGTKLIEGYTESTGDTMSGLLHTLYPDDQPQRDTIYHQSVRVAAAFAPSGRDMAAPEKETVERIVRSLPNTAPGIDGITAAIVKWAWKATSDEMWLMLSKCIIEGVFPDLWKTGRLVVLPKGNGKPLSDPKAYRPITLLPILGKLLERVIVSCAPCLYRNISEAQHGFTRGRSTVSALCRLNEISDTSPAPYVQLIFLDISGAFDNAWWPMILLKVKQGGAPPNLYHILVSYFSKRIVSFFVGSQTCSKTSTMGCPQGSVLGPTLWNILLNDLLLLPRPGGVHLIAYADDVTVVIEASSRADIERKANVMLKEISGWGSRNRLGFSSAKSLTMTYKGRFKRAPTIRFEDAPIRSVSQAALLGVTLDEARSYLPHANFIGEKASACFGKMSRVSATRWGVKYRALRVLYSGTYVATVTYAAAVWCRCSSNFVVRRALIRTQRPALILLTKAYRSCSSAALPVLAGVLPADLEVCRAGRIAQERHQLAPREHRRLKKTVRADIVAQWQERWQGSMDGRELYGFFPDVGVRLSSEWVEPDFMVSQVLTGHGCFRQRLHRLGLCESAECPCGESDESRDHALWECRLYADERSEMLDALKRTTVGPVFHEELVSSEQNFKALRKFAHSWHTKRRCFEE